MFATAAFTAIAVATLIKLFQGTLFAFAPAPAVAPAAQATPTS
jgi:hypothetical protein